MGFRNWILRGHCGVVRVSQPYTPEWVKTENLSPLNLESHIYQVPEAQLKIFKLENSQEMVDWFNQRCGTKLEIKQTNASKKTLDRMPKLTEEHLKHIRKLFPLESEIYNI